MTEEKKQAVPMDTSPLRDDFKPAFVDYRQRPLFSDIEIKCDDDVVHFFRLVLIDRSSVMRTALASDSDTKLALSYSYKVVNCVLNDIRHYTRQVLGYTYLDDADLASAIQLLDKYDMLSGFTMEFLESRKMIDVSVINALQSARYGRLPHIINRWLSDANMIITGTLHGSLFTPSQLPPKMTWNIFPRMLGEVIPVLEDSTKYRTFLDIVEYSMRSVTTGNSGGTSDHCKSIADAIAGVDVTGGLYPAFLYSYFRKIAGEGKMPVGQLESVYRSWDDVKRVEQGTALWKHDVASIIRLCAEQSFTDEQKTITGIAEVLWDRCSATLAKNIITCPGNVPLEMMRHIIVRQIKTHIAKK